MATKSDDGSYSYEGDAEFRDVSADVSLIQTSSEGRTRQPHQTSFGLSVFNLMNAVLGSGILGLSYAMSQSGIILFTLLLIGVALLACYSLHLLIKMCELTNGIKAYEEIGTRALKTPGRLMAALAILLQNIGAMSSYLFIVKNELPLVIRTLSNMPADEHHWYVDGDYLVLIMVLFIIAPLAFLRNIGFLGYTSGFSVFCMVFFTIVIIAKKFSFPCPIPPSDWSNVTEPNITDTYNLLNATLTNATEATTEATTTVSSNGTDEECTPKLFSLSLNTAYAVPTMAFSFVCHTAVLPIYEELKSASRARMQNVVYVTISVCFTMYMLSALFGYLTFYDNVQTELLEGYMQYKPHDTLMLIVRLAVLVSVTLTVPLLHFPSRKALTLIIAPNKPFSWILHIVLTLCLLTLITTLAIFVPNIREVFGFAGATSSTSLVFILPALFYIFLGKEPLKSREKIMAILLCIIGIVVLVLSVTLIIIGWTE
ncbi:probable sodium-coupled neutral amino acid transporter 6 [Ptychodera flava]|uniref:probable sodium-coupled neutral amino acid transporter 6 n=1 Tax=Ptychodera flava TaxID=63121 RepID=UPI00396A5158